MLEYIFFVLEFLNILIDISRSYTTINDMITHSLKMKQDTCVDSSDSSAIHLLDASISLQLYLKMKKTKDQDKINIAKENYCGFLFRKESASKFRVIKKWH